MDSFCFFVFNLHMNMNKNRLAGEMRRLNTHVTHVTNEGTLGNSRSKEVRKDAPYLAR